MPGGQGLRHRTRDLFQRGFRQKGFISLSTYLRVYKVGDYVDIKMNPAVHKGMAFKWYHGKTGIVWNVTKRAVGVEVNKQVRAGGRMAGSRAAPCSRTQQRRVGQGRMGAHVHPGTPCPTLFLGPPPAPPSSPGARPHHPQAHPHPHRAHPAQPLPRGLPAAPREQRRDQARGQGQGR